MRRSMAAGNVFVSSNSRTRLSEYTSIGIDRGEPKHDRPVRCRLEHHAGLLADSGRPQHGARNGELPLLSDLGEFHGNCPPRAWVLPDSRESGNPAIRQSGNPVIRGALVCLAIRRVWRGAFRHGHAATRWR
jgi:hypothetical protein